MNIALNRPDPLSKMNSAGEEGKMFVGGIKQDTTDEQFREYFEKFGELTDCVLMKDQTTNRPRGFGFIRYKEADDVQKVEASGPHFLNGKRIDPKQCLPRHESKQMNRSMGGGGGGGMGGGDAPLSHKVFIGGVGQTSEEDIQKEFGKYGNVREVVLMMDKVTGNCRGFGFVTFDNEETVNQLCDRRYVPLSDKRVECKRAQPRGEGGFGGPPGVVMGSGWPRGGSPGGPQMGGNNWNQQQQPPQQPQWNGNQGNNAGFGGRVGAGGGGNFNGGNYGSQGNFGGQQQQQQQQQTPYNSYGNQQQQNPAASNPGGYNQQSYGQNYGAQQQPQQQQQQQQPGNSYGQPQQNYGNYGAYNTQQPQQQQQQPNMYGNQQQAGGDNSGYAAQQNYSNTQQQQQPPPQQGANVGNSYAQEASGYGPTRVNNYNNTPGYTPPAAPGTTPNGQGQQNMGYYNGQTQQQQQQQPPPQQPQQQVAAQQPQQQPMQTQQAPPQQQQSGNNYGQQQQQQPGPPGTNYNAAGARPAAVPQTQPFHPYRR